MTREEAIEILQSGAGIWPITDRANNALNKAIKALSQQTEDAISRQAAIDAVAFGITYATGVNMETGEVSYPFAESNHELRKAIHRICELPLVTPKQRTGHWIWENVDRYWVCSECERINEDDRSAYCKYCGAKMVEPQEREDKE